MPESFLNKFIKKGDPGIVVFSFLYPVNFAKFLRTPFLQNISGQLLLKSILSLRK